MLRAFLAVLVATAMSSAAYADEAPATSEQVVAAFEAAVDNHDLTYAASLFAEDARIMSPGPINGRLAVAEWLTSHYSPTITLEVSTYAANGQRVTWMSRATRGAQVSMTWDEAVVVNGQIALWSSRALADTRTVLPRFHRAWALAPRVPVPAVSATLTSSRSVPEWLLGGWIGAAVATGALYGVWRQRCHPLRERQSRQGGRLLLRLRDRFGA